MSALARTAASGIAQTTTLSQVKLNTPTSPNLSLGEGYFTAQRALPANLPNPEPLVSNLARGVFEALAGTREVEQIARWVSPDVFSHLLRRTQHAARARRERQQPVRRPTIYVRRALWQSPRDGIVEATVIVDLGVRARAVAIRLEVYRNRWRAERINIL
ncbi:Rv3235 family protein [Gulosibacter bifidus]|uniref:Rv3235 family protein n=1 Tax=Gulosibacter bifidus TaxID=272239 RepID=A0ABW5RKZ2_9MICO|nr:Rv3235 family protein [Gulosibacter bifidus]